MNFLVTRQFRKKKKTLYHVYNLWVLIVARLDGWMGCSKK